MIGNLSFIIYVVLFGGDLIPAQSEAVLLGSILLIPDQAIGLVLRVASLREHSGCGYQLGVGKVFSDSVGRRLFSDESRIKWVSLLVWTVWLGLYFGSWIPIIGDPLTLCQCYEGTSLAFLLVVTFAKTARYVVLAATTIKPFLVNHRCTQSLEISCRTWRFPCPDLRSGSPSIRATGPEIEIPATISFAALKTGAPMQRMPMKRSSLSTEYPTARIRLNSSQLLLLNDCFE